MARVQSRAVDVLADDAKRFYDSYRDSGFKRTVVEKGIRLYQEVDVVSRR